MQLHTNKKEMKDKWIAALRSGKYKQATYSLHTLDGFCCLGVAAVEWGLSSPAKLLNSRENKSFNSEEERSQHFEDVHKKLQSIFDYSGLEDRLIPMNDIQLVPFPEIADYIETVWDTSKA